MKPQTQRILKALQHGPVAVCEWVDEAPDGGPPIHRIAARVGELRDAGHRIQLTGRRRRLAVYELARPT